MEMWEVSSAGITVRKGGFELGQIKKELAAM